MSGCKRLRQQAVHLCSYNRKAYMINKAIIKPIIVACIVIMLMAATETYIQYSTNHRNSMATEEIIIDRVESILEENDKMEDELLAELNEEYIIRAKAAAYMLNQLDNGAEDVDNEALLNIMTLSSVDELSLFDKDGKIYCSSVRDYVGMTMDDGDQIGYFKPMLSDIKLNLVQGVTPNTYNGKSMIYAATWNEDASYIIQIGVEPVRLLSQYRSNAIENVIDSMPIYDGYQVFVADRISGEIVGASSDFLFDKNIVNIKLDIDNANEGKNWITTSGFTGVKTHFCYVIRGDQVIGVYFDDSLYRNRIVSSVLIMVTFLVITTIILVSMFAASLKRNQEK